MCRLRSELVLNEVEQPSYGQTKGESPVWLRKCTVNCDESFDRYGHIWHLKRIKTIFCNFPLSSIFCEERHDYTKISQNYKTDSDYVNGLIYTHVVVKLQRFRTWIVISTNMFIFTYKADMLIQHNICSKIYDIKKRFFQSRLHS